LGNLRYSEVAGKSNVTGMDTSGHFLVKIPLDGFWENGAGSFRGGNGANREEGV
jgi:hypothetical protein